MTNKPIKVLTAGSIAYGVDRYVSATGRSIQADTKTDLIKYDETFITTKDVIKKMDSILCRNLTSHNKVRLMNKFVDDIEQLQKQRSEEDE